MKDKWKNITVGWVVCVVIAILGFGLYRVGKWISSIEIQPVEVPTININWVSTLENGLMVLGAIIGILTFIYILYFVGYITRKVCKNKGYFQEMEW